MKRSVILGILLLQVYLTKACLILLLADGEQVLVANHEDWFAKDTALKIIPPSSSGYGSVIFTFESEGWAQGGMNEHGLFFDGVFTPFQEISFDANKKAFPGYIWQSILDKCKNVDEAIDFLSGYKLPELTEAHIVLADADGNGAMVGVKEGKVFVHRVADRLLQTNFNPWHPELSDEPVCQRYETALKIINEDVSIDKELMMQVLANTHQDSLTVYSNVYDLKNKTISVIDRRDFDNPFEFSLEQAFARGAHMVAIPELRSKWDNLPKANLPLTVEGIVVDELGKPLPFVNIGILGTDHGTISDPDGSFVLSLNPAIEDEKITFSSIGYEQKSFSIEELNRTKSVTLAEKITLLDEVVVDASKRYRKARLGYMKGRDGTLPFDTIQGGGAVALLLESPSPEFYVDKVQLRLMYNSKDTLQFRLHFYSYDSVNDCPGVELLTEEIILKEQRRFGWMKFDLEAYDISIDQQKFFIALEWIEEREHREKMLAGLRNWEKWKVEQYNIGNDKVELVKSKHPDGSDWTYYKYRGNMMNWPGWDSLPPFTGLMVETGKNPKTEGMRTFERKTSFGLWKEKDVTLNSVVIISY